MKGIVPLSVVLAICIGLVRAEAGSKDEQPKQSYNNLNVIGSTPKPDLLSYQQITQHYGNKYQPQHVGYQQQYQPRTQHLQQAVPYNHQPEPIKRPYLVPQHQPVAMVIIAQPAYIPASMLQNGNVAQQLLQYFQGANSQARYQYIPANHQPIYQQQFQVPLQTHQQFQQYQSHQQYQQPQQEVTLTKPSAPAAVTQPQAAQSQFMAHEALPTPQALVSQQHHVVPHHLNQPEGRSLLYQHIQQQTTDYQPQQLQEVEQDTNAQNQDITRLAQQAAQHFLLNGGLSSGSRTAPAIITGLEHFSPEQQEKIKAQLGAHFGSPLKPLNLEGNHQNVQENENNPPSAPSRQYHHQQQGHRHQIRNNDKFVPSIQVKDGEITQTAPSG